MIFILFWTAKSRFEDVIEAPSYKCNVVYLQDQNWLIPYLIHSQHSIFAWKGPFIFSGESFVNKALSYQKNKIMRPFSFLKPRSCLRTNVLSESKCDRNSNLSTNQNTPLKSPLKALIPNCTRFENQIAVLRNISRN